MNSYQARFRGDIFEGIVGLSKTIVSKITIGYILYYGIIMALIFALVMGVLGSTGFSMGDLQDPEAMTDLIESIAYGGFTVKFIAGIIILYGLMLIISCWQYYFSFIVADSEIKNQPLSLGEALSHSLNSKLLQVFLLSLVLFFGVIMICSIVVGLLSLAGSIGLSVLGILICMVIFVKTILIFPAFILGDKTMGESIAFSFEHMTWVRVFKVVGITIVVGIGFLLISLVIGLVSSIFSFIPYLNQVVSFILNALIGGLALTIMISSLSALYYRYAEDIESDEMTIEDHLISDY